MRLTKKWPSLAETTWFFLSFILLPLVVLVVALKTQAANVANCFTVKIKQIKWSDMVTLLFPVHTPRQSNKQGVARAVDLPARLFDLARPGVAPPLGVTLAQTAVESLNRVHQLLLDTTKRRL